MKRYTVEVVIDEGNDEYWENLTKLNKSGADEITIEIRRAVEDVFPVDTIVRLVKYEEVP